MPTIFWDWLSRDLGSVIVGRGGGVSKPQTISSWIDTLRISNQFESWFKQKWRD
jgi:hypothetical protein